MKKVPHAEADVSSFCLTYKADCSHGMMVRCAECWSKEFEVAVVSVALALLYSASFVQQWPRHLVPVCQFRYTINAKWTAIMPALVASLTGSACSPAAASKSC
mmetsp:Transcript_29815/g.78514  ORF Transcript_29815/g.78514 Transcript_29815/m.78514 type:complete len:103 (-) Transcript_29815:97-405(-)